MQVTNKSQMTSIQIENSFLFFHHHWLFAFYIHVLLNRIPASLNNQCYIGRLYNSSIQQSFNSILASYCCHLSQSQNSQPWTWLHQHFPLSPPPLPRPSSGNIQIETRNHHMHLGSVVGWHRASTLINPNTNVRHGSVTRGLYLALH